MVPTVWILGCTVLALNLATNGVFGKQRCYACIPNTGSIISEVLELWPSGPALPLCKDFRKGKKSFIRDCPEDGKTEYKGCKTERNGTHVAKTCATADVNDCKTANNISYCFCTGELCNIEEVPPEEPRQPLHSRPDDDEDMSEGSGTEEKSIEEAGLSPKATTTEDNFSLEREEFPVKVKDLHPSSSSPKILISHPILTAIFSISLSVVIFL